MLNEVVRGWSEGGQKGGQKGDQKGGQKDDVYRTFTETLQKIDRKA